MLTGFGGTKDTHTPPQPHSPHAPHLPTHTRSEKITITPTDTRTPNEFSGLDRPTSNSTLIATTASDETQNAKRAQNSMTQTLSTKLNLDGATSLAKFGNNWKQLENIGTPRPDSCGLVSIPSCLSVNRQWFYVNIGGAFQYFPNFSKLCQTDPARKSSFLFLRCLGTLRLRKCALASEHANTLTLKSDQAAQARYQRARSVAGALRGPRSRSCSVQERCRSVVVVQKRCSAGFVCEARYPNFMVYIYMHI